MTRPATGAARRCEPACFAAACVLVYALLATLLFLRAPLLFVDLDRAFDTDLGSWTIDLARPQGPHLRTQVHPLSVLMLNPLGSAIRVVLRAGQVDLAARLAAQLLCSIAGGITVGAFRALLARLDVDPGRARLWTLLLATSTTQVVFSSVPESYAISALGLVAVFLVAARQRPARWLRLAVGVFAFGVTLTNLVAVALARASALDWRRPWRALRSASAHVAAVLLIAAALSLLQRAVYPTTTLFFVPKRLANSYERSLFVPDTAAEAVERLAGVVSHMGFASLAASRLQVAGRGSPRPSVEFADIPILTPTPVSAVHWLIWGLVLLQAVRGAASRAAPASPIAGGGRRGVVLALGGWLGFLAAFHYVFGSWLFLYSAHWVFALLALTACGIEARPGSAQRTVSALLVVLVALQVASQAALVTQLLAVFAAP